MVEPLFYFPTKTDKEQYEYMLQKSECARECVYAFKCGNLIGHSQAIIELVKIGYSRDEINSFLRVLYDKNDERIRLIEETMSNLYEGDLYDSSCE